MTDRRGADEVVAEEVRKRPDLSVTQLLASGLATVLAAVGASRLGVAGTILGAAFMSVVSTAGSVLMRHYMDRGKEQVRIMTVDTQGRQVVSVRDPNETRLDLEPIRDLEATRWDLDVTRLDAGGDLRKRRWSWPSWKVLAAGAGAVFVITIGGMMVTQAVTGKPPSSWPGGGGGHGANLLPGSDSAQDRQSPGPSKPSETSTTPHSPSTGSGTPDPGSTTPTPAPSTAKPTPPTPTPEPSTSTPPTHAPTTPPAAPAPRGSAGLGAQ